MDQNPIIYQPLFSRTDNDKRERVMNVRLTQHGEALLKQQLAEGGFHSPEEVIERALESLAEHSTRNSAVTLAEFDAALDALSAGSDRLPVLPSEATTRAGIYRDRC